MMMALFVDIKILEKRNTFHRPSLALKLDEAGRHEDLNWRHSLVSYRIASYRDF